MEPIIKYLSSLFDNEREAATLYIQEFGKLPSRAVFQKITKPFGEKFLALFELEQALNSPL